MLLCGASHPDCSQTAVSSLVFAQPGVSTYHLFWAGSRTLVGGASMVHGLDGVLCLALAVLEIPDPRCCCGRAVLDRLKFWLMTVGALPMAICSFLGAESWLSARRGGGGGGRCGTQVLLLIIPQVCLKSHRIPYMVHYLGCLLFCRFFEILRWHC